MAKNMYSALKSWSKMWKELLIWGLPQLAAALISWFGTYAEMTVAGVISLGVRWLVDWLKHK